MGKQGGPPVKADPLPASPYTPPHLKYPNSPVQAQQQSKTILTIPPPIAHTPPPHPPPPPVPLPLSPRGYLLAPKWGEREGGCGGKEGV